MDAEKVLSRPEVQNMMMLGEKLTDDERLVFDKAVRAAVNSVEIETLNGSGERIDPLQTEIQYANGIALGVYTTLVIGRGAQNV